MLLDDGFHATGCPAIDVAPQRYPADQLSTDVAAVATLARWIARSRGQSDAFDGGGVTRTAAMQAAACALHEIDLARWGREHAPCAFTWPAVGVDGVLACAFYAEPGTGRCGIHLRLPDYPYLTDPIYTQPREVAVLTAEPLGEHLPTMRTVNV